MIMRPWDTVYLPYRYKSLRAQLIPPRIARGTGWWWSHDGSRFCASMDRHNTVEAIYSFRACMTTDTELAALEGKPQEEW